MSRKDPGGAAIPTMSSTDPNPAVREFIDVLRRRRFVISACLVVAVGVTIGLSLTAQKQYTASAMLLFRDPMLDQKLFGSTFLQPNKDPAREAATNVKLVSLGTVAELAAKHVGHGLTGAQISKKLSIQSEGQSDVASIAATDPSPSFAARLANTVANEYVAFRRRADQSKLSQAEGLVRQQLRELPAAATGSPEARSLESRAEELTILASLQTGNAELVQRALPPHSPSSPRTKRDIALAVVAGLVLGVVLAFLFDRLDQRLRSVEEFERVYGLPLLGVVPSSRLLGARTPVTELPFAEAEAFRTLRARLRYFNVDREVRSVAVTSSVTSEGKSTVAWYLAAAAARSSDNRVLLIESDLRRPSLAQAHGLNASAGLAEVLSHTVDYRGAVQRVLVGGDENESYMDVLLSGGFAPNPGDLLESRAMSELLQRLDAEYDFVVVDTPPISVVSDAIPLLRQVSGVIVVGRLHVSTRDTARTLQNQVHSLQVNVFGLVTNGVQTGDGSRYGYGYGYSQVSPERQAAV